MDVIASYNMLLKRPWTHMTRVIALIQHQLLKFLWENLKIIIHDEGNYLSQLNGYVLEIIDSPRGNNSNIVEIVNADKSEPTPHKLIPLFYKVLDIIMIKRCFTPGRSFRKNSNGIIQPIMIPIRLFKYGLVYILSKEDERKAQKKG